MVDLDPEFLAEEIPSPETDPPEDQAKNEADQFAAGNEMEKRSDKQTNQTPKNKNRKGQISHEKYLDPIS